MKREIKFRAWDENSKEMINPYLYLSDNGHFYAYDMTNTGNVVKPENVMQFTGLKDKNGVEVYEGDIVFWPHLNSKYFVYYNEDEVGFFGKPISNDGDGTESYLDGRTMEVIGNIYEHKHLLQ